MRASLQASANSCLQSITCVRGARNASTTEFVGRVLRVQVASPGEVLAATGDDMAANTAAIASDPCPARRHEGCDVVDEEDVALRVGPALDAADPSGGVEARGDGLAVRLAGLAAVDADGCGGAVVGEGGGGHEGGELIVAQGARREGGRRVLRLLQDKQPVIGGVPGAKR